MDEQKIIIICIIIMVALGIILGALRPKEILPNQQINTAVDELKQACITTCETGNEKSSIIAIPKRTNGYTSQDAICFSQDEKLYCATCSCTITETILFNTTNTAANMTCTIITDSPGIVRIQCN